MFRTLLLSGPIFVSCKKKMSVFSSFEKWSMFGFFCPQIFHETKRSVFSLDESIVLIACESSVEQVNKNLNLCLAHVFLEEKH